MGEPIPPHCPSCGRSPTAPRAPIHSATEPFRIYFGTVWTVLTRPSEFFAQMPLRGGVAWPLAFALITHWLGDSGRFLWQSALGERLGILTHPFFQFMGDVASVDHPGRGEIMMEMRDRILHWMWGAGSVIADPFVTLVSILISALFVFIGARILVTPGRRGAPMEITFESALRLVCFAMAPAILAALPLAGGVISAFFVGIIIIIGAKNIYRVGWGRATIVGLFPKLLFIGIIMAGFVFAGLAVLKIVLSVL